MRMATNLATFSAILSLVGPTLAYASSYQQIDGTIVDPILDTGGNVHAYSGPNLEPGASLEQADLIQADLHQANLSEAFLDSADLQGADLSSGTFVRTRFGDANLNDANLQDADLRNASFFGGHAYRVNAANADFRGASMDITFAWANLEGADMRGAGGEDFSLYLSNLTGANLKGAYCEFCNVVGADFTDAIMIGFSGYGSFDATDAVFTRADLSGAHLREGGFGGDLSDANLTDAVLQNITFGDSNVSGANFSGATLITTYLGLTLGSAYYDRDTDFSEAYSDGGSTLFDPVAAGWTLIPEPSTALLLSLGLVGLRVQRWAARSTISGTPFFG